MYNIHYAYHITMCGIIRRPPSGRETSYNNEQEQALNWTYPVPEW